MDLLTDPIGKGMVVRIAVAQPAAVARDDPRLAPIRQACADTGAAALVGAPIVDADGSSYIATLLIDGVGATVAYRKIHLHPPEDERFTPGGEHVVLELDGLRLGLAICRDASLAEHAAATVRAGAEVYVASTLNSPADSRSSPGDGHRGDGSPGERTQHRQKGWPAGSA